MTKRDTELQAYKEYQTALQEAEKKKPEDSWYKINAENGSQVGSIEYRPQDDILTIKVTDESGIKGYEGSVALKGEYIGSVYRALSDLLSETEEETRL